MKQNALVLATVALFANLAYADAAPTVATNFSVTSNYKYRGQDQANNKPAVQGGFDYAMGNFYVGNWNSSVNQVGASIEMDFYGGYKGEIVKDVAFDVGALQYYYPQVQRTTKDGLNTTEIYGAVSYSIVTAKWSHTISHTYFGLDASKNTNYFDLSANYEVAKGLTLNAHLGTTVFTSAAKAAGAINYSDYKLGATYDLGQGFSAAAAAVGANKTADAPDGYGVINKSRLIFTVTKTM